jgi:YbaB/EbfC DNA-binding family
MSAPIERRTTEQLLADAELRLRIAGELPERLAAIQSSAANAPGNVRATVNVHGALCALQLDESALAPGPDQLGEEIVRVTAQAHQSALYQGAILLGDTLGDAAALEALRSAGLAHLIDPDAPVLPYIPGHDPNFNP